MFLLQELVRRWEQYVADHEKYEDAYHNCSEWQKDQASKLRSCTSTEADKVTLGNRLAKLQVCVNFTKTKPVNCAPLHLQKGIK